MDAIRQTAAVAAVLGLLGLTLWLLRRRGFAMPLPGRKAHVRRMECVERLALGPQHALHLVRLGERALLVSSSPAGCALVESFPWSEDGGAKGGEK